MGLPCLLDLGLICASCSVYAWLSFGLAGDCWFLGFVGCLLCEFVGVYCRCLYFDNVG